MMQAMRRMLSMFFPSFDICCLAAGFIELYQALEEIWCFSRRALPKMGDIVRPDGARVAALYLRECTVDATGQGTDEAVSGRRRHVDGSAEDAVWVTIREACFPVSVLREIGLFGRWVVGGSTALVRASSSALSEDGGRGREQIGHGAHIVTGRQASSAAAVALQRLELAMRSQGTTMDLLVAACSKRRKTAPWIFTEAAWQIVQCNAQEVELELDPIEPGVQFLMDSTGLSLVQHNHYYQSLGLTKKFTALRHLWRTRRNMQDDGNRALVEIESVTCSSPLKASKHLSHTEFQEVNEIGKIS
ncbi:hypothetical protein V8E53_001722 [Lactarius tabidus]